MNDEMTLHFNLDDEDNEKRVVVRVSELVRCLKHFRESLLSNGGDYEHDMREMGGHLKAAELGSEPPYDELLRCLENDWHIRASWDGLRKFWCVELTEDGVRMRDATHGTLTAEQVRECVQHVYYDGYNDGFVHRGHGIEETDWQAIADELNVMLGSGTCKIVATSTNNLMYPDYMVKWYELSCGHSLTLKGEEEPKWCAVCGKVVGR